MSSPALPEGPAGATGWRSLPGQTALLGAGYGVRSVGSLALAVLLTRELGPAGYGQVSAFLAVSWGLFYVTGSWLLLTIPALGARDDAEAHRLSDVVWSASAIALAGMLGGVAVLGAGVLLAPDAARDVLDAGAWPVIPAAALALLALHCTYALLQGVLEAGWVAILQGVDRLAAALLALVALQVIVDDPVAVMWAMAAAGTLAALAGLLLPVTRRHLHRPRVDRALLARTARFSTPLAVTNVCAYVVGWCGVLVLAVASDDAEVGIFGLASSLYALPVALAGVWVLAAVPAYVRAGADERLSLAALELAGGWWAALLAAAGVVAVAVFGALFGADFEAAAGMLALMLIGASTLAAYYATVPALVADGRNRTLMWVSVAGAVLTLVIDVALVDVWGAWAMAVGTLVQALFATVAMALVGYGRAGLAVTARTCALPAAGLAVLAAWAQEPAAVAVAAILVALALALAARRTSAAGLRGGFA